MAVNQRPSVLGSWPLLRDAPWATAHHFHQRPRNPCLGQSGGGNAGQTIGNIWWWFSNLVNRVEDNDNLISFNRIWWYGTPKNDRNSCVLHGVHTNMGHLAPSYKEKTGCTGHLAANNLTHKWLQKVAVYNQDVGTSTYFSPHLRVGSYFWCCISRFSFSSSSSSSFSSVRRPSVSTSHRNNTNRYHTDITTPSVSRIITPAVSPRHHHTMTSAGARVAAFGCGMVSHGRRSIWCIWLLFRVAGIGLGARALQFVWQAWHVIGTWLELVRALPLWASEWFHTHTLSSTHKRHHTITVTQTSPQHHCPTETSTHNHQHTDINTQSLSHKRQQ